MFYGRAQTMTSELLVEIGFVLIAFCIEGVLMRIFCFVFFCLQDHPGLRGTPLAMLAAQCNKLSNKSPPPLADAAVGKGFHPWKKSPISSGPHSPNSLGSPQTATSSAASNVIQSNQRTLSTSSASSSASPMSNFTTRYVTSRPACESTFVC